MVIQILENSYDFALLTAQTEMVTCTVHLGKSKVLIVAKTSQELRDTLGHTQLYSKPRRSKHVMPHPFLCTLGCQCTMVWLACLGKAHSSDLKFLSATGKLDLAPQSFRDLPPLKAPFLSCIWSMQTGRGED